MTEQQENALLRLAADRILFAETEAEGEAACADALALLSGLPPLNRPEPARVPYVTRRPVRRGRGSY